MSRKQEQIERIRKLQELLNHESPTREDTATFHQIKEKMINRENAQ